MMKKNSTPSKGSTKNANHAGKKNPDTSQDCNKEKSQPENDTKKDKDKDKGKSQPADVKKIEDKDPNEPDRSYGDYYCTLCDSHMNSDAMWEAHITGKRHQKSLMKGDSESKYESLDVESDIKYEIRNVKDPIVGLSYIHEIRRKESNIPPFYSCFLCHATLATIPLVIEHIISLKHRLNYIKENEPSEYDLLQATNLKKDHLEPLVQEAAMKLEQKYGRGEVLVKQEKAKKVVPYKRSYDDDDQRKPAKNLKNDDLTEPSVWKSVNSGRFEKERPRHNVLEYFDDHSVKYPFRGSFSRDAKGLSPPISMSYKRPELDDHSRRLVNYPRLPEYDDFRLRDTRRRSRSPTYGRIDKPNLEPIRKSYSPVRRTSDDYYSQSRSHSSNLLPHEMTTSNETKNFTEDFYRDSSSIKDFFQKVLALPDEILLKVFLTKLESMEIKGTEELNLLTKIVIKSQSVVVRSLPPELRDAFIEKYSKSISSSIALSTETQSSNPQSDISFIKEMLSSVRSSEKSSSASLPTQQYSPLNKNTSFPTTSTLPPPFINPLVNQNAPSQQYYPNSQAPNSYPGPSYNYLNTPYNNRSSLSNYPSPSPIPGLSLSSNENPVPQRFNYQHFPSVNQPFRKKFPYK